ncbi:hypothetical protein SUGI_0096600 [Cryptomeria japonica]|nr:hypothetical protein SUGI_0096600 [Cryptomeria japonica]
MAEVKEVVSKALLPLQLSLGIWQIMKLTPLWAVMHCTMDYLLTLFYLLARSYFTCFSFPDTDYNKLHKFRGRVFKKVISHATTVGNVSKVKKQKNPKKSKKEGKIENGGAISIDYLGKTFELEKKEANKMLVKDGPAYYITDEMWKTVLEIKEVARETVFVKNHKELWEEVVTGDIMEFEEVLDSVILDNRAVIRLDQDYFLPVNLLKSEDKVLKILNLVGLFLQTQKDVHWLIPASLSFTSAFMGFSTTLRLSVGSVINKVLCGTIQFLCDLLPLRWRRRVYFIGNWVDNLRPSNDLQLKIVEREICPLIAGGAKAHFQSSAHPCDVHAFIPPVVKTAERDKKCVLVNHHCESSVHQSKVGPFFFKCADSLYIEWIFDNDNRRCSLKAGVVESRAEKKLKSHDINVHIVCDDDSCKMEEDMKILPCDCCVVDKVEDGVGYCMSVFGDVYCGADEIEDGIDTASVDVDCSSKEAIKLFKLALYMAEQNSGSLKSYDQNAKVVSVRCFIESINAYVRSGYPPLYKLDKLKNVVVL